MMRETKAETDKLQADPAAVAHDSNLKCDSYQVTLQPSGQHFEIVAAIASSTSVLKAAADAQIIMPSSCRNGTCRECICQLESGQIAYLIDWPGVSIEEKHDGWILPCVAVACSDLVIKAPRVKKR